jgi:hypothetical protein
LSLVLSITLRWQLPTIPLVALALNGALLQGARAESVPFTCEMLPDKQTVRIVLSNPSNRVRSCMASCQFQTPKYGGEVQIICAHPVEAGAKDLELCVKTSGGEELVKQSFGSADCINF